MTEGSINKVLYNVDQRGDTTEAEKKTARDNIGAVGADEVPGLIDDRYKLLQIPTDFTFAANAVVNRIQQDAQGVVTLRCSYITTATENTDGLMSAEDKTKLDGISYGAEQNVQADWDESDPASDAFIRNKPSVLQVQSNWLTIDPADPSYILNKPDLSQYATQSDLSGKQDTLTAGQNITITNNVISATAAPQEQADWAQSNSSAVDYIKNKPQNLVQDANYVHTDNNFTTAEKNKLSGIESGAEANVQADWTENDSSSDAYIQNKPTIPAPQVNSDWNSTSGVSEILNKPDLSQYATQTDLSGKQDTLTAGANITITNNVISAAASTQLNADWDATSGVQEILNKPVIPVVPPSKELVAGTAITMVEGNSEVVISADYKAGYGINIGPGANNTTVISNTMHPSTFSNVFYLDTLSNTTNLTMYPGGKWRLVLKQLPIYTFSNGGTLNKVFLGIRYLDEQDIPAPGGGYLFGRTYPYWSGNLENDMTTAKSFYSYNGHDPYNNGDGFAFSLMDPRDTERIRPIKQEGYSWDVNAGADGAWIHVEAEPYWNNANNDAPGNALYIRVFGTVWYPYS